MNAKFTLGKLVATRGVAELSNDQQFADFVAASLKKYTGCDWGDMSADDCALNNHAVKTGDERIHGSYTHPTHKDWKIWIITEWDRSVTTILFPSEY